MKKIAGYSLLAALALGVVLSINSATVAPLSSFGATNSLSLTDQVTVATAVGTTNEHLHGVQITNLFGNPPRGLKVRIPFGASASNVVAGGVLFSSTTATVGAGTAETNLLSANIGANSLTNSQDAIEFVATGKFSLTGQSKQLKMYLGSTAFADTGSQAVSNSAWVLTGYIIGTGSTAQYYTARLTWGQGPFSTTNWSGTMAETNGILTVLKITGTAGVTSSITNEFLHVRSLPGPI